MIMEGYVFESYDEVVTFLTERGPVRQFQVLYLDDDEELPPEWTLTIPNSETSEAYADE
jgi:hypothetical protein